MNDLPTIYTYPNKASAFCCGCMEIKSCTVRRELIGDGSYWIVWTCDVCGWQADEEFADPFNDRKP